MRALLFDVDGTLAETEDAHLAAFNDCFAAHGLGWHWDEMLYRDLLRVAGGRERIVHYLERWLPGQAAAFPPERIAALHRDKTARYLAMVAAGQVSLRPGVARLMAEARAAGLKIGIVTNTHLPNIIGLLQATLGTADGIDAFATGGDAARKKPAPDLYRVALDKLGVAAAEALAIEDAVIGLTAAVAAGIPTLITRSRWSLDDAYPGAVAVVDGLETAGLDDLRRVHRGAVKAG